MPHITGSSRPPTVSVAEVQSDAYGSAEAVAEAFGASILVPSWWPADVRPIEYSLKHSRREYYQVGSVRQDGAPICVIGWHEVPGARSPRDWLVGEWFEPSELSHKRGVIGRVGEPPRLQAVIYDEKLEVQLIGYETEGEIFAAVRSLSTVAAR